MNSVIKIKDIPEGLLPLIKDNRDVNIFYKHDSVKRIYASSRRGGVYIETDTNRIFTDFNDVLHIIKKEKNEKDM